MSYGFNVLEPDFANTYAEYPIILASQQGREDILQYLAAYSVDMNRLDQYGNNALWAACYAENEACCRLLVEKGCFINHQNLMGNTALTYAVSSGKDNIVQLLVELGADLSMENQEGMTAMDLAITLPSLKLLRAAIK